MRDRAVAGDAFRERDASCDVLALEERSMPRCTNHSRAFIFRIVSPTTEKRKCPGSMSPACTGPTGISYTPGPST